jgi:hypothetical protein
MAAPEKKLVAAITASQPDIGDELIAFPPKQFPGKL